MNRSKSVLFLILAGSVLAGCAAGPDYTKPELATNPKFNGQAAVDQRQISTVADLAAWWVAFDDPLLASFVTRALDQNLDIAGAAARVAQSRAALRSANAALLPSGTVGAQAAKAHQSLETPLGQILDSTPDFDRNGEYYEANLGASWEIDLFGGLRRSKEAARADYQAAEAGVAAARLAVAAQTGEVYVAIRGIQVRLAIAREQTNTQRRLLQTVQLQFDKGIAAELQVRQAEGALAQVEATVPVLETTLDAAMNSLDVLLGVSPGTYRAELSGGGPIPVAPGLANSGSPADLLRRRPDLIAAERKLAAANARIGVAVSEYYPKFSLGALLGTATTTGANMFSGDAAQAQAILGLRWRLFDFGRVDAQIATARGQTAEALIAYRLAALRASEDVENALSALVNREAQTRTLARGETSLIQARDTSLAAYQGGVVSLIEVLDADSRLLATRDAKAQAQTEAARAAIESFRALGGGWNATTVTATNNRVNL
jgi:NodT family efflux transporter outer membrane factor (OMF) lipoprotein